MVFENFVCRQGAASVICELNGTRVVIHLEGKCSKFRLVMSGSLCTHYCHQLMLIEQGSVCRK